MCTWRSASSGRPCCTDRVWSSGLTSGNCRELLFDDVLWAERAREEHDAFAQTLPDRGVTVHLFDVLLAEALEIEAARAFVLDRTCTADRL